MDDKKEKPVSSAFAGLLGDEEDTETITTSGGSKGDNKTDEAKEGETGSGALNNADDDAKNPKPPEESKTQKPAAKKTEDKKEPVKKPGSKKETPKKSGSKKETAKKPTESKSKAAEVVAPASVEGKLLFEHGIDMRGGIEDDLDFDTFRKIIGSAWKNELVGDSSVPQRVSIRNMEFIKLIADTNKISLTQSLNNVLAFVKYNHSEYFKKLQKEREQIDL